MFRQAFILTSKNWSSLEALWAGGRASRRSRYAGVRVQWLCQWAKGMEHDGVKGIMHSGFFAACCVLPANMLGGVGVLEYWSTGVLEK